MNRDDEVFAALQRQQTAYLIEREIHRAAEFALLADSLPVPYLPAEVSPDQGVLDIEGAA